MALVGVVAACAGSGPAARQEDARVTLPVTDTVPLIERDIAPGLRLEIRRDGDRTGTAGWEAGVYAMADTSGSNLLYHSREWHGPYPTQVFAWSEAANYFGDGVRELAVRGYPWVVLLECERCTTEGTADSARFTGGDLTIAWRRLRDR